MFESPAATVLEQRVRVSFDYTVTFARGVLEPHNPTLADALSRLEPSRRHRVIAFVDDGVARANPHVQHAIEAYARAHASTIDLAAPPVLVPGGEACKNDPSLVEAVLGVLDAHRLDRQSFVVVIGGGAVLDLVGYAASIVHRGLRVVRLPTTVLAQGDSGVGVKTGVNAGGKKNAIGTFAPPFAVVIDPGFLRTLEDRDAIAGMAEAVKVALLEDAAFFEWIEANAPRLRARDEAATEALVRRAAELHALHIAQGGDPFEHGSARPLDFGHWSAHKLEILSGHRLRHGEAVAIGMAIDTFYASRMELASPWSAERLFAVLEALGFRLWDDALDVRDTSGQRAVLAGLEEFREHLGGQLTIILVPEPGRAIEAHAVDRTALDRAIDELRQRAAA